MSTLSIDVVTDATAAAADLDQVASAARGAGDAVSSAGGQVASASTDFDALGGAADNVSSKSSQAAGAMGDLAGGLNAVGATGAATALEGVGLATQVAAGAGDVLNLVAETTVGRYIATTAAAIGNRVATVAGTVATGAMTAAQWALNAAMTASPLGLIVAALALLTAGVILAYKHSETFREIVDGAMTRARVVIDAVSDAVQNVIGWFADLPGKARAAWDDVRQAVADKIDAAIDKVTDLVDKITGGISGAVGAVSSSLASMFAPIQAAIDLVADLIYKLTHLPHVDLNPLNRQGGDPSGKPTAGGGEGSPFGTGLATSTTLNVTVEGALDKDATARQILDILRRYNVRVPEFGAFG